MTINDYLLYHPSMTISATKSVTINEFHLRINLVGSKNWGFTVSECFQESTQPLLAQLFNQLLGTPGGPQPGPGKEILGFVAVSTGILEKVSAFSMGTMSWWYPQNCYVLLVKMMEFDGFFDGFSMICREFLKWNKGKISGKSSVWWCSLQ